MKLLTPQITDLSGINYTEPLVIKQPGLKVLIVGVFGNSNCSNIYFANGFEQLDYVSKVTRFDYRQCLKLRYNNIFSELRTLSEQHDLMVICKGNSIPPDAIKNCRDNLKIFLWFMDWYPQIVSNRDILNYCNYCHYRSATGYETALLWSSKSKLPIYHIPDGGDLNLYHEIPNVKKINNISFIGGKDVERESIQLFLKSKKYEPTFYGPGWNKYVGPELFKLVCNNSKIMLNISRGNYEGYTSLRLWSMMSCGSFILTKNIPGMEEHFGLIPGEHLDVFHNLLELDEKIDYYLKHPDEMTRIGMNARKYISENRTWCHSAEDVIKIVTSQKGTSRLIHPIEKRNRSDRSRGGRRGRRRIHL